MVCKYQTCDRHPKENSEYCIYHMPHNEKETKQLWDECNARIMRDINDGRTNFKGAILKNLNLNGRKVESDLNFSYAEFFGLTIFSSNIAPSTFNGILDFSNSQFNDEVEFSNAKINHVAVFINATFTLNADLSNCTFYNTVSFSNADFQSTVKFHSSEFHKPVDFIYVNFLGEAFFDAIIFHGKTNFQNARFHAPAHFYNCQFNEDAIFSHCKFIKGIGFDSSTFQGESDFWNSSFLELSSYHEVTFYGIVKFDKVRIDTIQFLNSNFKERVFFSPNEDDINRNRPTMKNADFSDTFFEKGGSFDNCVIEKGDFSNASIHYVSFNGVVLDDILFTGSRMEFAYLSDSLWNAPEGRTGPRRMLEWLSVSDGRYIIREELEVRGRMGSEKRVNGYKDAEGTYRRIKHSLNNEGDYEKAGEFYIREMRMKRKRYREQHRLLKWLAFWLSAVVTGYGEKWRNVVMTAFAIVLIYAIAYHAVGAISPDGEDYEADFRESLYFSVVTFTTLGYGDYAPITEYQLLAVSEAFIGAFTIALFVLVFGRKMMR